MKTKSKISGYIIRSAAYAVFLSVAFIALFATADVWEAAPQAGAQVRTVNHLPLASPSTVHEAWVRRYNGPGNGQDIATAMTVDASGNVYVTGASSGSGTDLDYATIKYNSAGQRQWVARYNGAANGTDVASAIALDAAGNVYVTGGAGDDCATIKYNSAGQQQWVRLYNAHGVGKAIAVDVSGNVYVTGDSSGPSATDYLTIKYNTAGQQQWFARYDHSDDVAEAIAVDQLGNVYVTGGSFGSGYDYATVKYNSGGQQQWVARYDGPFNGHDTALAISVDNSGAVYVTGVSDAFDTGTDYATVKYNATGQREWVARYAGPGNASDQAYAMAVDTSGNIYVTGGAGGSGGYGTVKYDSAGQQQWVAHYNHPGNASAIALDSSGNVYVTGATRGFGTYYDYATVKYNSTGQEQWVARYNGPGPGYSPDQATAIAVDALGNVYVTGYSAGSGTGSDYTTIKYVQEAGPTPSPTPTPTRPSNDDFADAIVISTTSGSLGGTNKDSTTEIGEPAGENSVWYRWTAPNNGEAHFRIGMDWLRIDVYTGTAINALTRIATSSGSPSAVNWTTVAGTTYRIRLTKNTRPSAFTLIWSL